MSSGTAAVVDGTADCVVVVVGGRWGNGLDLLPSAVGSLVATATRRLHRVD